MPPAMGQPINVVEKPTSTPGIARFETNRSLTGMGHERYASIDDVLDDRPVDVLAKRLFETGGVTEVHANGSVVTVHLTEGWTGARLLDVIRGLYIFYPPAGNGEVAPDDPSAVTEAAAPEAEAAATAEPETATEPGAAAAGGAEAEEAAAPEAAVAGAPDPVVADAEPEAGTAGSTPVADEVVEPEAAAESEAAEAGSEGAVTGAEDG
jgi:hypothetical protein